MGRSLVCFLLVMIVLSQKSYGQFTKGIRMTGATLGNAFFNSGKYEYTYPSGTTPPYSSKTNSLGITLSPNMGWFVTDKLVVGGQLILQYNYYKTLDIENNVTYRKTIDKSFDGGLGAFARNYFSSFKSFAPFGQIDIDITFGSSSTEGFNYTNTTKETFSGKSSGDVNLDAGLSLGVTKMLNSNIGLDIFAGYIFSHDKKTYHLTTLRDIDLNGTIDETSINNPSVKYSNHGFMIGAGFQIFLSRN